METLVVELADLTPWLTLNHVVDLENYVVDHTW